MNSSDLPEHLYYARKFLDDSRGFKDLVEGAPVVTYVDPVDEAALGIYISPQIEEILGIAPAEWLADPVLWHQVLHVDDRERITQLSEEADETGDPFLAEYRMHARDGREVWIRDEAVLVEASDDYPAFWMGVMLDVTELKRAERRLLRNADELERLSEERKLLLTRLEQTREDERKDIAADIHDDSIQVMSAASLRLQMLDMKAPEEMKRPIEELVETVNEAIERLRHLVFELRPVSLDTEGLKMALTEYLEDVKSDAGFSFRIHDRMVAEPPQASRTALYRIAQETIANIRKHAKARYVEVVLETEGDGIRVHIDDDGVGFDVQDKSKAVPGHMGIAAMLERVRLLGGELLIDSSPGAGSRVEYWLPMELPEDEDDGDQSDAEGDVQADVGG